MTALFDLPATTAAAPAGGRYFAAVVGLDLSTTSTGVARIWPAGGSPPAMTHHGRKGSVKETLTERRDRIKSTVNFISTWYGTTDLVVIEGPSYASTGGGTWDRAGLWWHVVDRVMTHCPVAVVAPRTRAAWAADDGGAGKKAVTGAMRDRLAGIGGNPLDIANSDEADALALAWMGAQWLGWLPATKDEQRRLKPVAWPAGVIDQ
jgi:crossover junction endodeoxyribonuclease RuvC